MSDYYQQMMNYHYAYANRARRDEYRVIEEFKESARQKYLDKIETIEPGLTVEDVEFRLAKFEEELGFLLGPDKFTNYLDLIFPKKPLVKIHPETLQRCTRSINDA